MYTVHLVCAAFTATDRNAREVMGQAWQRVARTADGRNGACGCAVARLLGLRAWVPAALALVSWRWNGAVLVEVPTGDAADLEVGAEVEVRRAQPCRRVSGPH